MLIGRSMGFATPMSAEDKAAIVQCHNNYRSQLALGKVANKTGQTMPTAANMAKMVWDDGLGKSAQDWASKCQIQHSGTDFGENLYFSSWRDFPNKEVLEKSCNAWWSELAEFGINKDMWLDDDNLSKVGHWTQMAWFNSVQIGCAVANCDGEWQTYVVCHYNPGGNYVWMSAYKSGPICSECEAPRKCNNSSGLCE
ncbi:hypothetical protein niasHS_017095 [Heterodera schachtii]|uniref:SCP domain-containing protein n=1 Tax=Heterodera schachtii TaxID=97005 RepID=A0ABD2I360_HETSC